MAQSTPAPKPKHPHPVQDDEDEMPVNGLEGRVASREVPASKSKSGTDRPDRYDITKSYVPVAIVALLLGGAFQIGRVLENYRQEQSAVVERVGRLETQLIKMDMKFNKIMLWILKSKHR